MAAPVSRHGVTLVETLALLGVLGALTAIAFSVAAARPTVAVAARGLVSRVVMERMNAVVRGQASMCINPPDTKAAVRSWPPRGLLFTPDGLPRTCDGGGVGNTTILLEHRGRQVAVIVSSLGRVRWELR